VPYLGRKSCPLGLPLAPRITDGADPPTALLARHSEGPEAKLEHQKGTTLRGELADVPSETTIVLDAADADRDDPRLRRIELRRDQPRSRRRWQFDLREEAVLGVPPS
jgi:CRISPR system Cascade subunit CasD